MLRRFRVDNFKSLINVTYEPGPVNLIVGINNSGKTNLCQAIRFLSLSASLPLSQAATVAVGEAWNLPNVYFAKPTIDLECVCDLPFEGDTLQFEYTLAIGTKLTPMAGSVVREFVVSSESLRVTGGGFSSVVLLENNSGQARILNEQQFLSNPSGRSYMELPPPQDSTLLSRLYNAEIARRASLFRNYLLSWRYYDLEAMQLRRTDAQPLELTLRPDGSNLISVLFNLNNLNQRLYRQVIEAVKSIEPRMEVINFIPITPQNVYMLIEDRQGNRFGPAMLSNGTLRFLALCYILLNTGSLEYSPPQPAPLTIIEEPENGIYVGHLKRLFERIDTTGASGQFIFTSHSPYFIDLFDGCLEGVRVMKGSETHSQLVKPDVEKLRELLGEFSLGELHFRGMIA